MTAFMLFIPGFGGLLGAVIIPFMGLHLFLQYAWVVLAYGMVMAGTLRGHAVVDGRAIQVSHASIDTMPHANTIKECQHLDLSVLFHSVPTPDAGDAWWWWWWGMTVRNHLGGSYSHRMGGLPDGEKKSNQKEWKIRVGYGRE